MSPELEIRSFRTSDSEEIKELQEKTFRDAGAFFEEADDSDLERLEEEYGGSRSQFLVGVLDEQIVASGAFQPAGERMEKFLESSNSAAELKRVYVLPKHQRKGFGQRILEDLEERARKKGYSRFVLETMKIQEAAIKFYLSNGFEEVDNIEVQEGQIPDVVIMSKRL